jgi:hypothetical protein
MKIFVVTPYYREDLSWLIQAHESVKAQGGDVHHIMICDGVAPAPIPDFHGTHVILQRNYRDYGNTPRLIGCQLAMAREADAVAFLDADNWYHADHLSYLSQVVEGAQLDAVASARMLHRLDGSPMMKCPTVDGVNFIDTSCLLVMRGAFRHLVSWVLQDPAHAAEADQRVWRTIRDAGGRMAFVDRPSVAYRTRHAIHYEQAREAAPAGAVIRTDLHGDRYH